MQTTALDNTHAEHRSLQTKLEALEQRQSAAAQLASEAAHSHSLQVKQLEMLVEEHQRRMQSALSKTELRTREAAEQIADRTVAEAQAALQVCVSALYVSDCVRHAIPGSVWTHVILMQPKLLAACY